MPRSRKLLIGASAALALAAAWFVPPQVRFLRAACGYAAKVACSAVFLGGRALDDVRREELARFWILDVAIDRERRTATASAFGVIAATARYRDGLGATPVHDDARVLTPSELAPPAVAPRNASAPWPDGDATDDSALSVEQRTRLRDAVDAAFLESDPAHPRRTRAVVVVHRDRLVAERTAPGFARDAPQHGWSMSKTVLASLFGVLAHAQQIDLIARAPLASWRDASDGRERITTEHLLRMTSGLEFTEDYEDPDSDALRMLFLSDDMAAHAASRALVAEPGTRWAYSSGTSLILARVLRDVVGDAAITSFARDALFAPLGMRTARFEFDASGTPMASSFVWASPRDWARLGLLWRHDGVWNGARILADGFVRLATTPTPQASEGRFGAHVWLNAGDALGDRVFPELPPDTFWAAGFDGQYLFVVPSREAVIVRLGQTPGRVGFDAQSFVAAVLAALR